jgi:hypothetical protein
LAFRIVPGGLEVVLVEAAEAGHFANRLIFGPAASKCEQLPIPGRL